MVADELNPHVKSVKRLYNPNSGVNINQESTTDIHELLHGGWQVAVQRTGLPYNVSTLSASSVRDKLVLDFVRYINRGARGGLAHSYPMLSI